MFVVDSCEWEGARVITAVDDDTTMSEEGEKETADRTAHLEVIKNYFHRKLDAFEI